MMAVVNGGIYPIVVAQALKPFPQAAGRAAAAEYAAAGIVLPDQFAGIGADRHAAAVTTTSVMLVSIGLAGIGYRLQQTPELTPTLPTRNAHRRCPDQSLAC